MNLGIGISSLVILSIIWGFLNLFSAKNASLITSLKKSFSFVSAVFALLALELGGSMMLGTCEQAYSIGFLGILYVLGISLGFLLLGFGFAARMRAMNVENTIDLFQVKYKSPLLRLSASLLSTLTCGGLLIGQLVAAKSLVHALGIKSEIIFIMLCAFIIMYAIMGGLKTAGITYSAQLIYCIIVFGGIFVYCMLADSPSFFEAPNLNTIPFDYSSLSFSGVFGSLVMPALYYLTDQEFAKPLFGLTNKKEAALSAICAAIFMILFSLIPIYFGIKATQLPLSPNDCQSPLIPALKLLTNDWIVALAVIGIAGALIAMIDYYLWAVTLGITQELGLVYESVRNNSWYDKTMLIMVGIVALCGSYCTTSSAIQVLLYSYELYDSCLIVPLLMSYLQTEVKKGSAIGAFIAGLGSFILFRYCCLPLPQQLVSLLISLIGFYGGGWIEDCNKKIAAHKNSKTCSI